MVDGPLNESLKIVNLEKLVSLMKFLKPLKLFVFTNNFANKIKS